MVFKSKFSFFVIIIYYLIHRNIIIGWLYKKFFDYFFYKGYKFKLIKSYIPTSNYSSFFFKTYEINDRVIIERNISNNNKAIIIGGGIGFIATLTYKISKKKILIFEINPQLVQYLKENLKLNRCNYFLYNKKLVFKKEKKKKYFLNNNFLDTSSRLFNSKNYLIPNTINIKNIKNYKSFNTLIIDAEGDEFDYIKNISLLKNIRYIFFELHYNLLNRHQISKIFSCLKKNQFILKDKYFNSFYFKKKNNYRDV